MLQFAGSLQEAPELHHDVAQVSGADGRTTHLLVLGESCSMMTLHNVHLA